MRVRGTVRRLVGQRPGSHHGRAGFQNGSDVARLVGRKEHNGLCDFVLLPAAKSRPGTFGSVLLSQNVRKSRSNAQPIRPMRQIAAIHLSLHPRHDAFGIDQILRAAHFQFLKQQVLGGRKPQISAAKANAPITIYGN